MSEPVPTPLRLDGLSGKRSNSERNAGIERGIKTENAKIKLITPYNARYVDVYVEGMN